MAQELNRNTATEMKLVTPGGPTRSIWNRIAYKESDTAEGFSYLCLSKYAKSPGQFRPCAT